MVKLVFLFFLFGSSLSSAAQPPQEQFTLPLVLKIGTQMTSPFNVPANTNGTWQVSIPCDPALTIQMQIRLSQDQGKTWDCDGTNIKCSYYFRRTARACTGPNGLSMPNIIATWAWSASGTKPQIKGDTMQGIFTVNKAVNSTITLTFLTTQ